MAEILPSISYVKRLRTGGPLAAPSALPRLGNLNLCDSSEAAQRVWTLLDSPQTLETLNRVMAREFHFDAARCSEDVRRLLDHWLQQDLIQISPDT